MIFHVTRDNKKQAKEFIETYFLKKARVYTKKGNWNFIVESEDTLLNYVDNYYNFYMEI